MVHTNPAYEEEAPAVKRYYFFHDLILDTADKMDRDIFEQYANTVVKESAQEVVDLMLKEYDDRKNPVKDDTVVS